MKDNSFFEPGDRIILLGSEYHKTGKVIEYNPLMNDKDPDHVYLIRLDPHCVGGSSSLWVTRLDIIHEEFGHFYSQTPKDLRDNLAGQVISGIYANSHVDSVDIRKAAELSYRQADEMLRIR